jgi:hypothetical protein
MLSKSPKSAFIIGIIFTLAVTTTQMIMINNYDFTSNLAASAIRWPLLFALSSATSALLLYSWFDDSHFGYGGAVRWAVFGILFALSRQINWSFLSGSANSSSSSNLVMNILLRVLVIFLSYWLLFKVLTPKGNQGNKGA